MGDTMKGDLALGEIDCLVLPGSDCFAWCLRPRFVHTCYVHLRAIPGGTETDANKLLLLLALLLEHELMLRVEL